MGKDFVIFKNESPDTGRLVQIIKEETTSRLSF